MIYEGVNSGDELAIFTVQEDHRIVVCYVVAVDGKQLIFKTTANHAEAIAYGAHSAFVEANARHIGPAPAKR